MKFAECENRTILSALVGSRLYGTFTEDSDYDYKGIFLPTTPYILGTKKIDQCEQKTDNSETVLFNISKYIDLALLNNPNILELLWCKNYITLTSVGQLLIDRRYEFLSTKVFYSFSGYAYAQIKKVKNHRNWLLKCRQNPDFYSAPPNPIDFGLDTTPLRKDQEGAFLEFLYILIKDKLAFSEVVRDLEERIDLKGALKQYPLPEEVLGIVQYYTKSSNDFMNLLSNTQKFRESQREYESFQCWKNNRNSKRAEIEQKCGYDSKHLSHAYRLIKMGIEILLEGEVYPDRRERGDVDKLIQIRNGQLSYENIMEDVDALMVDLESAKVKTTLTKTPKTANIEELKIEILEKIIKSL